MYTTFSQMYQVEKRKIFDQTNYLPGQTDRRMSLLNFLYSQRKTWKESALLHLFLIAQIVLEYIAASTENNSSLLAIDI